MDIEGTLRLYDDLEQVCYRDQHLLIVIFVSVPGLLGWAFGIPYYAWRQLKANVERLGSLKIQTGDGQEKLRDRESFMTKLGFLISGYSEKYYSWEIVLLLRKSFIVIFIVFFSSISAGMQSLITAAILTFFAVVQWRVQPFYDPILNQMEQLSLFVLIFTIYAGLFYQVSEGDPIADSEIVKWNIFLLVILPSIVFALNFLHKIRIEILKVAASKSGKLFRYLSCGSLNLTEFKLKYMDEVSDDEYEAEEL